MATMATDQDGTIRNCRYCGGTHATAQPTRSKYLSEGCGHTWQADLRHVCRWHERATGRCVCPCGAVREDA